MKATLDNQDFLDDQAHQVRYQDEFNDSQFGPGAMGSIMHLCYQVKLSHAVTNRRLVLLVLRASKVHQVSLVTQDILKNGQCTQAL